MAEKKDPIIINRYIKYITTCSFLRNQHYLQNIVNFYVFMRKPVLQMCAKQLISGVEFQISQNNRYEINLNLNFISFLKMWTFR